MADERSALVDALKATRGRGAEAWLALLRYDYRVALSTALSHTRERGVAAFRKLLQSYRTATAQVSAEQRRLPAFLDLLVDEACAHARVDIASALECVRSIKSLPGDAETAQRALDASGVAREPAPSAHTRTHTRLPEAPRAEDVQQLAALLHGDASCVETLRGVCIDPVSLPVPRTADADGDGVVSFRARTHTHAHETAGTTAAADAASSGKSLVQRCGGPARVAAAPAPAPTPAPAPAAAAPMATPKQPTAGTARGRRATLLTTSFVSSLSPVAEDGHISAAGHGNTPSSAALDASASTGPRTSASSARTEDSSLDTSGITARASGSQRTATVHDASRASDDGSETTATTKPKPSFELPAYIRNFSASSAPRGRSTQSRNSRDSSHEGAQQLSSIVSPAEVKDAIAVDPEATIVMPAHASGVAVPTNDDSVVIMRARPAAATRVDVPAAAPIARLDASMDMSTSCSDDDDMAHNSRPAAAVKRSDSGASLVSQDRATPPATGRTESGATGGDPERAPFYKVVDAHEVVRVNGRGYLKLECIGKGGSSRVYRVLGEDMCVYALKRVRVSRVDASTLSSYVNEIALLRRLNGCRHVIRLADAEISYETKYVHLVMEYGQIDLNKLLADETASRRGIMDAHTGEHSGATWCCVDINILRLIWQQMLLAVQTIHDARIVHGDLKPANFVFVEGVLKIIDFGIAKALSNDTTNIVRDSQVGTVNYMSPEAITDVSGMGAAGRKPVLKLGRASDIWSLGCILFQMVYGRTPFAHLNLIQKLHAISDPSFTVEFPPIPDRALENVLRACLQRDPAKRPVIGGETGLLQHEFLQPYRGDRRIEFPPPSAGTSRPRLPSSVMLHCIQAATEGTDAAVVQRVMQDIAAHPDVDSATPARFREIVATAVKSAHAAAAATASVRPPAPPPAIGRATKVRASPGRASSQPPDARHRLATDGQSLQQAIAAQAAALRKVATDKENEAPARKSRVYSASSGLEAVLRKGLSDRFAHVTPAPQGLNTSSADMDVTWTSTA